MAPNRDAVLGQDISPNFPIWSLTYLLRPQVIGISVIARICSLKEDQPPNDEEKNKSVVMEKALILSQVLENFIKTLDLL